MTRNRDMNYEDYTASKINTRHIYRVGNEVISNIYTLVRECDNLYVNGPKLIDNIEEITKQQLDSQLDILSMMGESEKALSGCDTAIDSLHHKIKRIEEFVESHISYNGVNAYVPWVNQSVYDDIYPEHKKVMLKVPNETTHLISFELIDLKQPLDEFVQSKVKHFEQFTEVDNEFKGKLDRLCRKYYNDIGMISSYPIKLVLPKTLVSIDETIFSWIRGVTEIECYEHQLEEVERAIEFNRKQIEIRKESLRKLFKLENTDEITALEDVTIIVLD